MTPPRFCQMPRPAPAAPGWPRPAGFTLMELLVVIAIIGALVAIGLPAARSYNRGSLSASASRQLMDDLSQARYRAIGSRSDVYVVFIPYGLGTNYLAALARASMAPPGGQIGSIVTNLLADQCRAYAIYSPRTVGDQPGRSSARYLTPWRTLPVGTFIATNKFNPAGLTYVIPSLNPPVTVVPFGGRSEISVPFPTADSPIKLSLPCIGFDYQGRLTSNLEETLPLAEGVVDVRRGAGGKPTLPPNASTPSFNATGVERPLTNSIFQPNLVRVDWLTGRARVEKLEVR